MDFSAGPASNAEDVLALFETLRAEKLMSSSEQEFIRGLNNAYRDELERLEQHAWICRQEQWVLRRLINSDTSVRPENCGQLIASLRAAKFVMAYRHLNHNAALVTELFKLCLKHPRAFAEFLNGVELIILRNGSSASLDSLCRCAFNVLYGSCIFPQDEKKVLDLIAHLISLQLVSKAEPRRVLRKGSSVFCKMYSIFLEQLFSAKVFLTAALNEPIMHLLSLDDAYLDVDPAKSAIRLPPEERRRRFGSDENSVQYKERLTAHRRAITEKLFKVTALFVKSIHQAVACFPASIIWLVRQLRTSLLDKKRSIKDETDLICTDLIFTNFICPAIIHPEPHGIISDTPISHVARFNLMQIGQIIQALALCPYEAPPSYMNPLLQMFTDNPMPDVVKHVLKFDVMSLESMFPPTVANDEQGEMYSRRHFIGSIPEIKLLVENLKGPGLDAINDEALKKEIKQLVRRLPDDIPTTLVSSPSGDLSTNGTPKTAIPRSQSGRLRILADKVQNAAKIQHQKLMTNLPGSNGTPPSDEKSDSEPKVDSPQVLVFEIGSGYSPLGVLPEEKVMSSVKSQPSRKHNNSEGLAEKKTRFKATGSVVSDRTGTTDAASDDDDDDEGEGVPSLCSSSMNDNMADEDDVDEDPEEDVSTLPDNYSDVVPISANVSGRGSPSLSGGRGSGRGTPFSGGGGANGPDPAIFVSSTAGGMDLANHAESVRNLPRLPVTVRKQNPEGLEEKFGKFGLPPPEPARYGDETYSLVSDSWSTDVVASDNEGISDQQPKPEAAPHHFPPPIPPRLHESVSIGQIIDIGDAPGPSNAAPLLQPNPQPPPPVVASHAVSDREKMADDILNKYRFPTIPSSSSNLSQIRPAEVKEEAEPEPTTPYYDPTNITRCKAFQDAKRKLRFVLSSAGNAPSNFTWKYAGNTAASSALNVSANEQNKAVSDLNELLKFLLAESMNNQDRQLSAQIGEVQRCLAVFDCRGVRKLLRTLNDEYRRRTSYRTYLQQSRQSLLQLNSYVAKLTDRITRDQTISEECLIELVVRYYLDRKENFVKRFVYDFKRLKTQDEKTYTVEKTLEVLYGQLNTEAMWKDFSETNMEYVRKTLDRALMDHVFYFALYPNGEADQYRDEVFFKSLRSIAPSVTPDHPELRIPRRFHGECPWQAAQNEIVIINAYKSPRDKLACVMRCCETIESLIKLSSGRSAVSADDITPVLVYVLLQANPPSLLSNIQYISGFYNSRIVGEEAYWWTQFHAAVEFLKQLCNRH